MKEQRQGKQGPTDFFKSLIVSGLISGGQK